MTHVWKNCYTSISLLSLYNTADRLISRLTSSNLYNYNRMTHA